MCQVSFSPPILCVVPCLEPYFPPRFMIFFKSDFKCFKELNSVFSLPSVKFSCCLKHSLNFATLLSRVLIIPYSSLSQGRHRKFLFFLTASLALVISPVCLLHRLQDYSNQFLVFSVPCIHLLSFILNSIVKRGRSFQQSFLTKDCRLRLMLMCN